MEYKKYIINELQEKDIFRYLAKNIMLNLI